MSLLVPDEGKLQLAKDILGNAALENWTLKIFSNNHTPAESDTAATYTEATFTGYVAKTLMRDTSAGHWAVPALGSPTNAWAPGAQTQVAESTYNQQSWSPTSSQTVYGVFVVGATSTKLIYAELFSTPRSLVTGDTLNFTPRFGMANAS